MESISNELKINNPIEARRGNFPRKFPSKFLRKSVHFLGNLLGNFLGSLLKVHILQAFVRFASILNKPFTISNTSGISLVLTMPSYGAEGTSFFFPFLFIIQID